MPRLPDGGRRVSLPMPVVLDRAARLEAIADQAFDLALRLGEAEPTRDGLGPWVIMARMIATELTALRDAS